MSLDAIKNVKGRGVVIPGDDIDTDRIIPARYLKCVTFDGIGEFAFFDERFNPDGSTKQHPLNEEKYKGASIIISGNNFGCGSSREHAPQSIKRAGFNGIIAESFAEIFYGNSTTLGIVCISLPKKEIMDLSKMVEQNPELTIEIDVEKQTVTAGGRTFIGNIKESAQKAFIEGTYDSLGVLLKNMDAVRELEKTLKYSFFG